MLSTGPSSIIYTVAGDLGVPHAEVGTNSGQGAASVFATPAAPAVTGVSSTTATGTYGAGTVTDSVGGTKVVDHSITVNSLPVYTVQTITDPNTGNIEYQMWENGFQFGTLLQTPQGAIGFRGHPDQSDVNGWGTTVQENVYITGSGVDATGGVVTSAVAGSNGIQVSAGGNVPSSLGTAGTWNWTSTITYDPTQEKVTLAGTTTVTLAAPLSGDMNVGRDDSNYLYDYPLNGGGVGPTGDMKSVTFTYGPDSSVRENQWTPLPGLEGTSPQDASDDVTTIALGTDQQVRPQSDSHRQADRAARDRLQQPDDKADCRLQLGFRGSWLPIRQRRR